jgi:putative membrane protein
MSERPRQPPFEAEADRVRLSLLPGDVPADETTKGPAPREFDPGEIGLVDEGTDLPAPVMPASRRRVGAGGAFAIAFALFTVGFLTYGSLRAVLDALSWWAPLGLLLALLLAGAVVTGLVAIGGELRTIRRQLRSLGSIEAARREADRLMLSRGHDEGMAFAARVLRIYEPRSSMAEPIRAFRQSLHSSLRDHEVVARLSVGILRYADEEARAAIGRALRDTAFISLASPNGLVDSLITLWRELKMLREIAVIYGLAPGLVQQWTLLRRVLWIAATSGMAAQAGDMAVQSLGGGLVGRLSANAADALYTALRTARLGLYAMETCRPVPLVPEERRGLWSLLRKAAVSVLALLERSEGS